MSEFTATHDDGSECLWSVTDQTWYRMHPLYPLKECTRTHAPEPRCDGAGAVLLRQSGLPGPREQRHPGGRPMTAEQADVERLAEVIAEAAALSPTEGAWVAEAILAAGYLPPEAVEQRQAEAWREGVRRASGTTRDALVAINLTNPYRRGGDNA